MSNKFRKVLSILLSMALILNNMSGNFISSVYAQDDEWIKPISNLGLRKDERVLQFNLEHSKEKIQDKSKSYIEDFAFEIIAKKSENEEQILTTELLDASKADLKRYSSEGKLREDGVISLSLALPQEIDLNDTNISALSLNIIPKIRVEQKEDISIIKKFDSSSIEYKLKDEDYAKYLTKYDSMTDLQKKHFLEMLQVDTSL